ncbi:unnamed protein product [Protopolystoma xenopodis]|uniref:Dynein heavy chain ATP-binding dynein motor region domain-containing protein n=1 Tax=Protopolystoma xenopodis TaxID=117903 RepID=A0A448WVI2_9PLAT|nr:unnamed protein product [Protopolystoma xenopodis]
MAPWRRESWLAVWGYSSRRACLLVPALQSAELLTQVSVCLFCQQVTSFSSKLFRSDVEDAVSYGKILLIEDIGEEIDISLNHILDRNFIKMGQKIKHELELGLDTVRVSSVSPSKIGNRLLSNAPRKVNTKPYKHDCQWEKDECVALRETVSMNTEQWCPLNTIFLRPFHSTVLDPIERDPGRGGALAKTLS